MGGGRTRTAAHLYDRQIQSEDEESEQRYLRGAVYESEPIGSYSLKVSKGPKRTARMADMVLRSAKVDVLVPLAGSRKRVPVQLWAVLTREEGTTPPGEAPIDWLLLSNHPVESFEDAVLVVAGYATRWRIEEFHKMWKSGAMKVEDNQLRAADHIERWARLTAAVAVRLLRIAYLARNRPTTPALGEFTEDELEALIMLRKRHGQKISADIHEVSISQAVNWIAKEGGYTGKSSGGPPGALVLARGLTSIIAAAELLSMLRAQGRLM